MDFSAARFNMVECQVRTNRVIDPVVVNALGAIPRESFVPAALQGLAYVDEDISVGGGRFVMEPLLLGRMMAAAELTPSDVVLVIGDATGYATAVFAKAVQTVVSLECDAAWVAKASQTLAGLGIDNAAVVQGDLGKGLPDQAPFDAIIFAGAVHDVPQEIARQLTDGGRLVALINGGPSRVGKGTVIKRVGDTYGRRALFDAATTQLPGFSARAGFVF